MCRCIYTMLIKQISSTNKKTYSYKYNNIYIIIHIRIDVSIQQ